LERVHGGKRALRRPAGKIADVGTRGGKREAGGAGLCGIINVGESGEAQAAPAWKIS